MNPLTRLTLTLEIRSYTGSPYWPETNDRVTIEKRSGMNLGRTSEDKREEKLRRYLEKIKMPWADWQNLCRLSERPWYKDAAGVSIIIPRHQLAGCLVQASKSAPAGARFDPEQLRSLIMVSDFVTNRTEKDGIWKRYVLPTDAKGNPISNQRRYTESEVIGSEDGLAALGINAAVDVCTASGTVSFDAGDVKEKAVLDLFHYAGKYVGLGGSRKMALGRFSVSVAASITTTKASAAAATAASATATQR